MFRLPRPLIVGLGIVPPALMILTKHPWAGAATFTAVFATLLLRPRDRAERPTAAERSRAERLSAAERSRARELVLSGPAPAYDQVDDDLPRPPHDGLIHYPPRRL
jgi:hypothetical protein